MRVLRTVSALAALPVLLLTLFGVGTHEGLFEAYHTWQESKAVYQQALAHNEKLMAQRDEYGRQIERLRSDPLEQEWLVRSFGYIRPGEKVYRIIPSEGETAEPGKAYIGSMMYGKQDQ